MSNINANAINTTYPVAGQDNDSQGFRDNFTAIQAGLATTKSEITALQNNSVLLANLDTNVPVVNNLLGSTLSNGIFSQFNGQAVGSVTVTSAGATVNINSGPFQQFNVTADCVLSINHWPVSGLWGVVRLMLKGDGIATHTVSLQSTNTTGSPSSIKIPTTSATSGIISPSTTYTSATGTKGTQNVTSITVTQKSSNGVGRGATFLVTTTGGAGAYSIGTNTTIAVVSAGSGYAVGNTVTIDGASLGGTTVTNDLTFTLATSVVGGLSNSSSTVARLVLDQTHYEIIEAWSVDGGTTVFVKNIGEY